jgi:LmbE family N-acetylglucosaminyl deacetylase
VSAAAAAAPFDHREPGTSETEWAASGLFEGLRTLDLAGLRRLIVVAAHPDDESLGAGGLIAEAARRGVPVTVVVATQGEASHPDSLSTTAPRLAAIRRDEVRAAVDRLSPAAELRQLDLGDGRLAASVGALVAQICSLGDGPDESTWLVAPWRDDRHPDHAAAAEATRTVAERTGARLLEFPLWAWHWARPGDGTLRPDMLTALDLSAEALLAKESALAEHRSQVEPLSPAPGDEPIVPPGFRDHFRRGREVFVDSSAAAGARAGSLDREFFDEFYSVGADRWGFESRWYEKRKRAVTLASLPRERFGSAFEPGCAIGVLTAELAARCDHLLATDISAEPLVHARRRLAGRPGVEFAQLRVPQEWPAGRFDLIVLSEVGYYCGPADLSALIAAASSSLTEDGVLLACHWRHPVPEYPASGDHVHEQLRAESGLVVLAEHLEEDFRLDVLVRPPGSSVARRTGLFG